MSNLTGFERDAIRELRKKDITIAWLEIGLTITVLLLVGIVILTSYLI